MQKCRNEYIRDYCKNTSESMIALVTTQPTATQTKHVDNAAVILEANIRKFK